MAQNGDLLLNYVLKLDVRTPTPEAGTDFLRAAVAVVKPKGSTPTGVITKVISAEAAKALTDNTDVAQLFAGGMNSVFILPMEELSGLGAALSSAVEKFYTVLVSSDFSKEEVDVMDAGEFPGVVCAAFEQSADAKSFASGKHRSGWLIKSDNKAANMFYAMGAFLSSAQWNNCQYIQMPKDDRIRDLGEAEALFEDRVSFALTSEQYGPRLAFLCAGGQAIIAPYITQELTINLQGAALKYLNLNRPQYTVAQAKLLEDYLESDANARYVQSGLLTYARVNVELTNQNYVGTVSVSIPEPTALWRLKGILTQEALNA